MQPILQLQLIKVVQKGIGDQYETKDKLETLACELEITKQANEIVVHYVIYLLRCSGQFPLFRFYTVLALYYRVTK